MLFFSVFVYIHLFHYDLCVYVKLMWMYDLSFYYFSRCLLCVFQRETEVKGCKDTTDTWWRRGWLPPAISITSLRSPVTTITCWTSSTHHLSAQVNNKKSKKKSLWGREERWRVIKDREIKLWRRNHGGGRQARGDKTKKRRKTNLLKTHSSRQSGDVIGKWRAGIGKRRGRKKWERERIEGFVHMLLSCVNWRFLLLLGFPWKRGIFIGGWQWQWMDPCSVTPTNIIIITLYAQKWKMSATWEACRDSACMYCLTACQCVYVCCMHVYVYVCVYVSSCSWETNIALTWNGQKKDSRRQN